MYKLEYDNNELGSNFLRKGVIMCCRNRCRCREDEVRGAQQIALRGPGCISGTGQCEGVLGTGGRFICTEILGTGGFPCSNVAGAGGSFRCSNVAGTGGRSNCGQIFGTGGSFQCRNVAGAGSRRRKCCDCCQLTTPTTVPR